MSLKVKEIFNLHKINLKAACLPRYSEKVTVSNKHFQQLYFSLNICPVITNEGVSLKFQNDPREK